MNFVDLIYRDKRHIWHPFTQALNAPDPICIERGEGTKLFDAHGKAYLDMVSSWWVNLHGHGHPKIAQAIADQAQKLEQVMFADFTHEPAVELASNLAKILPGDLNRVFFSDNGSSSVEIALKLAIQYWKNKGEPQRNQIAAFDGSYHALSFVCSMSSHSSAE
jgi:adenosylmethionine-8-amino-7-oxononanoate aminotransferase